jgi:hypothetical protein
MGVNSLWLGVMKNRRLFWCSALDLYPDKFLLTALPSIMLLMRSMGSAGNPNPSNEPRTMSLKSVLKMPKTKKVKLYLSAKTFVNTLSSKKVYI